MIDNKQHTRNDSVIKHIRCLLDASPDPMALSNLKTEIIDCNKAALTMFGVDSIEEARGKTAFDFILEEDHDKARNLIGETIKTGITQKISYKFRNGNGEIFLGEMSASVIYSEKNKPKYLTAIIRDVSETQRVQDELARTKALLQAAIEQSPAGIIIADAPDGNIKIANTAALNIKGGDSDGLVNISIKNHSDRWQCFDENGEPYNSANLPLSKAILKGEITKNKTIIIRSEDNIDKWMLVNAAPVKNASQDVVAGVVVFSEVSELKKAEKALANSEAFNKTIVESSPVGILYLDRKGNIIFENPVMKKIMGRTNSESDSLIGTNIKNLSSIQDAKLLPLVKSVFEGQEVNAKEIKYKSLNNKELIVELYVKPIYNARKQIESFVVMVIDITGKKQIEENLKRSEEKYRSLIESIEEGIGMADEKENFSFVNPALCRILGYKEEELIGKSIGDLTTSEDFAKILQGTKKRRKGEVGRYEVKIARKDGQERDISISAAPVFGQSNQYLGAMGIMLDITDQKKAERALQESEERFRKITGSAHDAIIMVDFKGRISFWNKAAERIFGYGEKDIMGQTPFTLMPNEGTQKSFEKAFNKYVESGIATSEDKPFEVVARRKNNEQFPLEISISSVKIKGQFHVIGIARDITQRKIFEKEITELNEELENRVRRRTAELERVNKALVMSEKKFREFSNLLPQTVFELDEKKQFVYLNKIGLESNGYNWKDLSKGMSVFDLIISEEHVQAEKQLFSDLHNDISPKEFIFQRNDGSRYPVLIYISSFIGDLNEVKYRGIAIDITNRKKIEKELSNARKSAEMANQAKSIFLANMSHEIRTPINAIKGLSHLVLETDLNKKQKNYLEKIEHSTHSLLSIIDDILDFSKIEAGKVPIDSIEFDLEEVLETVADLVTLKAYKKDLEIIFDTHPEVPSRLTGDPSRLRQVLTNLCDNAVKFTEKGEIIIRTEVVGSLNGETTLRFSVKDTGIGISEKNIAKLFKPFSQADNSKTRTTGGTGLGLTISKMIVKMMNGEIKVESIENKGSTFSFTVPFKRVSPVNSAPGKPKIIFKKAKALVCVNNSTFSDIFTRTLHNLNLETTVFEPNEENCNKIFKNRKSKFDVFIVDWEIIKREKFNILHKCRKHESFKNIPVLLLLPPYGYNEILVDAEKNEIEYFLTKPVQGSLLYNELTKILTHNKTYRRRFLDRDNDKKRNERIYSGNILLVEDNEINQLVGKEILSSKGYNVEIASNGQEAVNKVFSSGVPCKYDLVLMDIQMPVMDGIEATSKILANKHYKDLPIIAMTADLLMGTEKQCRKNGMIDFVAKPIDPESVIKKLSYWIEKNDKSTKDLLTP